MCRLFLARTYMLKMVQTEPYRKEQLMIIVYRVNSPSVGHEWNVSCTSGPAKTILQGTVKGGRRQDRKRTRREDNIREWTGLEFAKSQRAVVNREKWRKLVVKSSVVPHRPVRLRARWWWWWVGHIASCRYGHREADLRGDEAAAQVEVS